MSSLAEKKVLITGGCGSIGSELVSRILDENPSIVRILDTDEAALFNLQSQYEDDNRLRFLLGDVRDRDRLEMAVEGIDVIFHAAALKHVGLTENNPFEAVQTNVQGTQNLIRVALEEEVDSFVTISTDKASNPVSVMGATKLLSERLVIAANTYKGNRDTQFGVVRFGNVLGSSGSVVPIFMRQIRDGGPVTVTSPEMTRFIMPLGKAANLVLHAHKKMTSGEVFVLKMPVFKVAELAEAMVDRYAREFGHAREEIDIDIVGMRPAERMHEKLISKDESLSARELENMYAILPQIDVPGYEAANYTDAKPVEGEYTSADQEPMSKSSIVEIVEESGVRSRI